MTDFTPGPWIAEGGNSKGQICVSHETANDVVFIAGVEFPIHDNNLFTKAQAAANAQLIAAAPDMYRELKMLIDYVIRECTIVNSLSDKEINYIVGPAEAAIAKAEGK